MRRARRSSVMVLIAKDTSKGKQSRYSKYLLIAYAIVDIALYPCGCIVYVLVAGLDVVFRVSYECKCNNLDSQCHTLRLAVIADECFGLVSVKLVVGLCKRDSTCLAVRP